MSLFDYTAFLFAFIGNGLLGRFITKQDWGTTFLAGLCFSGAVLAVTGWYIPIYTREIIYVLFLLALNNFVKEIKITKS